MQLFQRVVLGGGIVAGCLVLSACSGFTVKIGVQCKVDPHGDVKCSPTGEIKPSTSSINALAFMHNMGATTLPSAASFSIDTTGSTIEYPLTGQVTITLKNTSGNVVVAKTFAWVRSGHVITFQNAAEVDNWIDGYATSAASMSYQMVPFTAEAQVGTNIIKTTVKEGGTSMASASQSITYCPSGNSWPPRSSTGIGRGCG